MGRGGSSVVRALGSWLKVFGYVFPQEQQENFLLQGQPSVLTLFWYLFHLVLPQQHVKDPSHSAKSAGDRLQLNTHALYIIMWLQIKWHCKWCMVVWCTQKVHQHSNSFTWHQPKSHVKTKQRCQYTTSVDIKKMCYKRLVVHSESHATWVQWICSRAENSVM